MVFLRNGSVVQQRSFLEELLNLPFQLYSFLCFFLATLFNVRRLACTCAIETPSSSRNPPRPDCSPKPSSRRVPRDEAAAALAAAAALVAAAVADDLWAASTVKKNHCSHAAVPVELSSPPPPTVCVP